MSESKGSRATVEATIEAGGKPTATFRGFFVAVPEGIPRITAGSGGRP